jgi:FkbM family methyltransferase
MKEQGCWECDIVQFMLDAMDRSSSNAPFLLDMGGNIGMMTLASAASGYDTYTFEPFKNNFRHICRSVTANDGFSSRVHLLNRALSNEDTIVEFHNQVNSGNFGGISVSKKVGTVDENGTNPSSSTSVRSGGGSAATATTATTIGIENIDYAHAIRLDSLLPWLPPPSDNRAIAIKIDVEGSEMPALLGTLGYLEQHTQRIVFASMELQLQIMEGVPNDADTVIQFFLSKCGMKPMRIDNGVLVPIEEDWRSWSRYRNVLDLIWIRP